MADAPATVPAAIPSDSLSPQAWRRTGIRGAMLLAAAAAVVTGLCGGVWRLGWTPPHGASLAALHGPLLIGAFGILISLERAVALRRSWAYLAPLLAGFGTLSLLGGASFLATGTYALAAAALAFASLTIARQQPALSTGALLFGALAWLAGNLVWLIGGSVPDAVGWWLAFLILTIAGERLELSRLAPQQRGREPLFLFAAGLLVAGAQNGLPSDNGAILFGLALLLLAAWLLRHDIARRTLRMTGQPRYMAACMLGGYVWLGFAGVILLAGSPSATAFGYDAAIHAVLIGFVLSMVFGHALIILPALTGLRLAYRPLLYGPLGLLHASLAVRIIADLLAWQAGRQWSGIATLVALAAFAVSLAASRRARPGPLSDINDPRPSPS